MNKKTKNTFLIDIAVPNTHDLAKSITDKQKMYQKLANEIRGLLEKYPTFGREKETGLRGALDT